MDYLLLADMTCTGDISSCCSDYGIATYLFIMKKVLNVIHLVVPIILIIMATVGLVQLVINPDDPQKKKSKSLINKFLAAVLIYLIPFIINFVFVLVGEAFGGEVNIAGCWSAAEEIVEVMDETEEYDAETSNGVSSGSTTTSSNSTNNEINSSSSSSNTATLANGEDVVSYAKQFIGNPYVYGGTSLTNGTDCSGFVMRVYEHFGIALPRTAQAQSSKGTLVSSIEQAKPGDLLFYRNSSGGISHVTIYQGNNKVVHASSSRTGIIESDVNYRTYAFIKRII